MATGEGAVLYPTPRLVVSPACVPPPPDTPPVITRLGTAQHRDQLVLDGAVTVTVTGDSYVSSSVVQIRYLTEGSSDDAQAAPAPADAIQTDAYGVLPATTFTLQLGSFSSRYTLFAYYSNQADTGARTTLDVNSECPAPRPTITLAPTTCADAGATVAIDVQGTGYPTDRLVRASISTFMSDPAAPPPVITRSDTVTPAADGTVGSNVGLPLTLTFQVPAVGAYTVVLGPINDSSDVDLQSNAWSYQTFVAPCPTLTVSTCADPAQPPLSWNIAVAGAGWQQGARVEFLFDPNTEPQYFYNSDYVVDASMAFAGTTIVPYAHMPPGQYEVRARQVVDTASGPVLIHEASASVAVPCVGPDVQIQPTDCGPPQFAGDEPRSYTLTFVGSGFQAGLQVDASFGGIPIPGLPAQADGTVTFANVTLAAAPVGQYDVVLTQQASSGTLTATRPFRVPCDPPKVKLRPPKPNCGDDGTLQPVSPYQILVRGTGFIPGYVDIRFAGEPQPPAFAGDDGRLTAQIMVTARGPGTYDITATQADANGTIAQDSVKFNVPCKSQDTPMITIEPPTAGPGFVVQVLGTGFPANQPVALYWDYGIDAGRPIMVTAGPDGSFTRQVLIFAHDFTGTREMSAGTAAKADAYPDATAELLVGVGQGSPPSITIVGGSPVDQPPIVLRR